MLRKVALMTKNGELKTKASQAFRITFEDLITRSADKVVR